ncbi:MAG: phage tail spike protein [Acutalibacteraceae bacterium]
MYKITAKNRSGDTYTLYDPRSPALQVISPVCKLTVNKAGLLTLNIPPTHPYADKLKKLDTVLSLWQDDALLFRGRILNDEYDLYGIRKLEAEGELAYLNDSVQPLAVYHDMTVSGYFTQLLEIHNAQVEEDRRFVPGQVTVEDSNDSLYRQSNYENTLDAMLDKLTDRLGGYLVVRYGTDGTRYLDCLKEYGNVNSQRITARTNLLDFLHTVRGEDVATAIIPLGAQLEDAAEVGTVKPRLTIEAANDGKNYIFDEEAVAQWGWIRKVVVHDDITLVENLVAAGYKDLEAAKYLIGSMEADAVDLHLTDREIERIKLGDMILFEHPIDGEQAAMLVSGINLPVDSPGDTTFTLGTSYQTMTDNLISSKKDAAQQLEAVRTEAYTRTDEIRQSVTEFEIEVNQNLDGISSSVTETQTQITTTTENIYDALGQLQESIVTDEALEEVKQLLISQWSDELELRFTSVLNIIDQTNGTVEENQRLLEQYIRFEGARIELGRSDSVIKAVLQNDRLSFVESGQEVAYISNRTLFIKDAQITQTLRFGNADSGYYVWAIGENSTYELTYSGP